MTRDPGRRAVITGLGAITPIGNDPETFWKNLTAGVSGVARITSYDPTGEEVQIAAEVKDFDPRTWIDFKAARRMSRFSQLAVAAAAQALSSSGLQVTDANRDEIAVVVNTGGGGIGDVATGERVFLEQGGRRVSPFMVPMLSPSMAACQISIQNKLRGPVITSVAACASGVQAFVEAQRLIEHGDVDVAVTGGTESAILPVAFAALANMGALSKRNAEPQKASRPFDATRDGFVFGEAACVLVLEAAEHAERRGATILAEVAGGALTGDAFHISAPDPSGYGATQAMVRALRDAGVAPAEVDYVAAHGTSTPLNDATETKAIHAAFGEHAGEAGGELQQEHGRPHARRGRRRLGPGRHPGHPRWPDPAHHQLRDPGPGLRPGLRAQRRAQRRGADRDRQRVRFRRPERRGGLPRLRLAGPRRP